MDFAALVLLLGLMGTVCGNRICRKPCHNDTYHEQFYNHVLTLQNSSVAPWKMSVNTKEGRLPYSIDFAECKTCIKKDMVAKPIFIEIAVYEKKEHDKNTWCRCPFKLAVGCTCVMNK